MSAVTAVAQVIMLLIFGAALGVVGWCEGENLNPGHGGVGALIGLAVFVVALAANAGGKT